MSLLRGYFSKGDTELYGLVLLLYGERGEHRGIQQGSERGFFLLPE